RVGSNQRRDLERNVNTLGIIAHISPLMGLLGTVVGMIRAFMTIQALGGQVDATDLAGGISEALITTAAGLAVAIPVMILFHFIEGRVDNMESSIKDSAVIFPEIMGGYNLACEPKRQEPAGAGDGGADHGV
ncbi:MAG TPA: MotA/TolQ/ExbB proton channel family protein, partial [bacterium]|nr:MotA/TolQ/ExbB proton channel family protein [bacterium]